MYTPWGKSDYHENIVKGIDLYSTPSHGGFACFVTRDGIEWFSTGGWLQEKIRVTQEK